MLGGVFGRIVPAFMPDGLVSSPQAFAVAGMAAMMAGVVRGFGVALPVVIVTESGSVPTSPPGARCAPPSPRVGWSWAATAPAATSRSA